ncbi:MAG: hypothetical protein ACK53L_05115, partial [Pirellulaceae bacterium]
MATILAVLVLGSARHFSIPNSAESMRMTPYWRIPWRLKIPAMRQALEDCTTQHSELVREQLVEPLTAL